MAASTPKSKQTISCFCCLGTGISKTHKLCGKKCIEDSILSKICKMMNKTNLEIQRQLGKTATICRTCYKKITDYHVFLEDLEHSLRFYSANQWKEKRLTTSPSTPRAHTFSLAITPRRKKKARRELISSISQPQPQEPLPYSKPTTDPALPIATSADDHSYATGRKDKTKASLDLGVGLLSFEGPQFEQENRSATVTEETVRKLRWALQHGDLQLIAHIFDDLPILLTAAKHHLLLELDMNCKTLCSRTSLTASVLRKLHSTASLQDCPDLFKEIYMELKTVNPFLLDIFATVVSGRTKQLDEKRIAPLSAAYAILMQQRNKQLSAWHRLSTAISIKGHLKDEALTLLNHMGITLSPSSKLKIQDEAVLQSHQSVVNSLKGNPLVKITGDNLDIRMKTGQQGLDRHHKDLHYFASNMIFSKVKPDLPTQQPQMTTESVKAENFLCEGKYKDTLMYSYGVLVGRIMQEMSAFGWLVVPKHIPHSKLRQAALKTEVHPLPLQFKNEIRHEDCVSILDGYEDNLSNLFKDAHGNLSVLNEYCVPVGGDQLTRIRMEESKCLRSLATTSTKRFEHINPFVIEWWHNKQDFLEKAYKALYSQTSLRQVGTLYYYKCKLGLTDVNGKVKSNFKAHHNLLLVVGKHLIKEQVYEYFMMEDETDRPKQHIPEGVEKMSMAERRTLTESLTDAFLKHYGYGDYTPGPEKTPQHPLVHYKVLKILPDGNLVVEPVYQNSDKPDKVYNYSMNLCHWALHLLQLDDTAKEADAERLLANCRYNIPFFYSHSHLSKYMVENIDFVLKVEHSLSPLQRSVVLDTAFVNCRGGNANNVEADLVQEHSVRNQKTLIRQLGANKSEKAITRATGSADAICQIFENTRISLAVPKASSRHSKQISDKDIDLLSKSLRQLKPFHKIAGRVCDGFPKIEVSPFRKINQTKFLDRVNHILQRLKQGLTVAAETGDADDDEDSEDVTHLPDI